MIDMIKFLLSMFILLNITSVFASSSFIYHGDKVNSDEQFPFVVAIYNKTNPEALCTGTIIGDTWVLTAKHCVYDVNDPSESQIGIGYIAKDKLSAKKVISVKRIYVYDDEENTNPFGKMTHDVALLELSESTGIIPVELPSEMEVFHYLKSGNQSAIAIGYGGTNMTWASACERDPYDSKCDFKLTRDAYLHFGDEVIQSDQTIEALLEAYKKLDRISPSDPFPKYNRIAMLGAISPDGKHPLAGDSGGSLLIKLKQENEVIKYVQVGITSWGFFPTYIAYKDGYLDKEPVIYASLMDIHILNFIKKTMMKS